MEHQQRMILQLPQRTGRVHDNRILKNQKKIIRIDITLQSFFVEGVTSLLV